MCLIHLTTEIFPPSTNENKYRDQQSDIILEHSTFIVYLHHILPLRTQETPWKRI